MRDFVEARAHMVERQLVRRGIDAAGVLQAIGSVPREAFVEPVLADLAYDDRPLPIGAGQTISQPYVVALMAQAAGLSRSDQVLEIGAGSGYAAAVLSRLAAKVTAVERDRHLAEQARQRLAELGFENVDVRIGDGTLGWPDAAPYDAILVAACGPAVPDALKAQLKVGGRLVIPVGSLDGSQRLIRLTRRDVERFDEWDLGAVAFVPLVGAKGWERE